MGYHQAGFQVVGVDLNPQPRYPFAFIQHDALTLDMRFIRSFDAIHASPPCQRYCAPAQYNGNREDYPDLVPPIREMLKASGLPWVMENVPGAPLIDPVVLCGTMFEGLRVYRHRLFESNILIGEPPHKPHVARCARNGVIPPDDGFFTVTGGKHSRAWAQAAAEAMGVPWMTEVKEICEAIPPAYTKCVGYWLKEAIKTQRLAA